jgi:hypothetical protein
MDEISKTIALMCFIIRSGVAYSPKMKKKQLKRKKKIKFQFTNVNKNDENSGS